MPLVDAQPSQEEVDAIKQQLTLLGHSLPTNVIVKFLQDNSELLTTYQHPGFISQADAAQYRSKCAAMREPQAGTKPELAKPEAGPAQILPQLDMTWASGARELHSGVHVLSKVSSHSSLHLLGS